MRISVPGIDENEIPGLETLSGGDWTGTVTRPMKNNPRQMSQQDAEAIYQAAFRGAD